MDKRQFIRSTIALSLAAGLPWSAFGQARWPAGPVKFIVPFGAGGTTDAVARFVGARMSEVIGQPVVIDNRAGAGGAIGAEAAAKAQRDGYTFGIGTVSTHAILPAVAKALPYQPDRDFIAVGTMATTPIAIFVHPSLGVQTLAELQGVLRAKPGHYNFGSPGNGSLGHLAGVWFNQTMGTEVRHVPYRSSAPAMQDLLAGRVHMMFENIPTPLPHVRSGALRAIVVMGPQRVTALADVPTTAEAGFPEFQAVSWTQLLAPAGTPAEIVAAANRALNETLRDEKLRARLAEVSVDARGGSSQEAMAFLKSEMTKWGDLARRSGFAAN